MKTLDGPVKWYLVAVESQEGLKPSRRASLLGAQRDVESQEGLKRTTAVFTRYHVCLWNLKKD
jgi:hypothetical protein